MSLLNTGKKMSPRILDVDFRHKWVGAVGVELDNLSHSAVRRLHAVNKADSTHTRRR